MNKDLCNVSHYRPDIFSTASRISSLISCILAIKVSLATLPSWGSQLVEAHHVMLGGNLPKLFGLRGHHLSASSHIQKGVGPA